MRIQPLAGCCSEDHPDRWRESAMFVFADGRSQRIWIDIPDALKGEVSASGNHWLICGFMQAAETGEDIVIDTKVDPTLVRNLRNVSAIFAQWYGRKPCPQITASGTCRTAPPGTRRALFFSGGVDSMFSLFDSDTSGAEKGVEDLLTVWGFDIRLSEPEVFATHEKNLMEVAAAVNRPLIPVITNLRSAGEPFHRYWGEKGHGAAMAVVAHLLSPRYREVRIASSSGYAEISPWGSHPLHDPLFGSTGLAIVHDGATYSRVEKTARLAQHDQALPWLRVCNARQSAGNCSRCGKCIRTMLALDLIGARERATSFDWSDYDVATLAPILIADWWDRYYYQDIREAALRNGRRDIVDFCDRSFAYSRWMRPVPGRILNTRPAKLYAKLLRSWICRA